ncbi:26S proteasome subunit beta-4 [Acrasis kona]|uniref:26S proteasome subunit beta-4 n=1 Tax=Acrasis kona TaxID=1008807 RepID=A0AAW2ZCU3_9EUKA
MERCFHALQTLTETHQTVSALETLCLVVFPLLKNNHYPEGQKYLTDLMTLTLPGIDTNDMRKTWSTIKFYTSLLICVPLHSNIQGDEFATQDVSSPVQGDTLIDDVLDVDFMKQDTTHNQSDLNKKKLQQTPPDAIQFFDDWCIQVLDRIFVVLSHQSAPKKDSGISTDAISPSIFWGFCDIFFNQLSPELHERCARKIFQFVSAEFVINAKKNIGHMCASLSFSDPKVTLGLFVPMCYDRLVDRSTGKLNQLTETEIQWYVHILSQVVFRTGAHALKYKKELDHIIELTWDSDAKPIVKSSGKLIRNFLRALTFTYPKDVRSANPTEWNSEHYKKEHWRTWGTFPRLDQLQVDWHVPQKEQIEHAVHLVNTFYALPSDHIDQHIVEIENDKDKLTYTKKRVKNYLVFIRYIIRGGSALFKEETNQTDPKYERYHNSHPVNPDFLQIQNLISNNHISLNVSFEKMSNLLSKLTRTLLRHRSDQEPSVLAMIAKTLHPIVCMRGGCTRLRYKKRREAHDFAKQHHYRDTVYMVDPIKSGKYPRYMLVIRAQLEQKLRCVLYNETIPFAPMHQNMIQDLIDLSLSSYSIVRRKAQSVLISILHKFHIRLTESIMPKIIQILCDKNLSDQQWTGAIYLLEKQSSVNAILGNWDLLSQLFVGLCQTSHIVKHSIQNRLSELFDVYFNTYYHIPLIGQEYITKYHSLVNKLVELHDSRMHWKYQTLICSFLLLLIRSDCIFPINGCMYLFKCLTSDLEKIRQVSMEAMNLILGQHKPIQPKKIANSVIPGSCMLIESSHANRDEPQLRWTQRIANQPKNEMEWNATEFFDKNYFGWYRVPNLRPVMTYDYQKSLIRSDHFLQLKNCMLQMITSNEIEEPTSGESNNKRFIDKLFSWMVLREDSFNEVNAQFFKGMFQVIGIDLIEIISKNMETLLAEAGSGKPEEVHYMSTGAELLSGLARGTKHWSFPDQSKSHAYMTHCLSKVLQKCSMICMGEWCESLEFMACDRDPRRMHWIKSFLLSELNMTVATVNDTDLKFSSSSSEQLRVLRYIYGVLGELSWRDFDDLEKVLLIMSNHMAHPYEQVREYIATIITMCLKSLWMPKRDPNTFLPSSNVMFQNGEQSIENESFVTFIQKVIHEFSKLIPKGDDHEAAAMDHQVDDDQDDDDDDHDSDGQISSSFRNQSSSTSDSNQLKALCKTTMSWVSGVFAANAPHCAVEYTTELITIIALVQENATVEDEDLQNLAKDNYMFLAGYSYTPLQCDRILTFLNSVLIIKDNNDASSDNQERRQVHRVFSNWRIRASLLEFLQVFGFKQQFYLTTKQNVLFELLINLLRDPQVEVRSLACSTLAGFIKISDREHIEQLAKRFTTWVNKNPRSVRKRGVNGKKPAVVDPEHVITRHSGVLGLSAIIQAFPYTLPDFLPPLLVLLAQYSSDQGNQIRESVRKTFAEFWKGHGDTWHIQKKKFTEDQLVVLNDLLISPSYYA